MQRELKLRIGFFSIDWSYFLLTLLLPMAGDMSFDYALVYCAAVGVAITIHEFGHWGALKVQGIESEITLWIFGGLTSHQRDPRTRKGDVFVSAAGVALGFCVALAFRPFHDEIIAATGFNNYVSNALRWFDYACIAWGFVNLLPILPLDGGRIVQKLCEGRTNPSIPYKISMVAAIAAALWAYGNGSTYLAFIAAALAFRSYQHMKGGGSWAEGRVTRPPSNKELKRQAKAAQEKKLSNPVEVMLARGEEAMNDGSAGAALQLADQIAARPITFEQRIDLASLRSWAELMRGNTANANEALARHHVEPRHVNGLLAACLELAYDSSDVSPAALDHIDRGLSGNSGGRQPFGVAPTAVAALLARPDVLHALRTRYENDQPKREALASLYRRGGRPEAAAALLG